MSFQTTDKTLFNLVHGKKSQDGSKTYWNRVGVAIFDTEKNRISIHLDHLPIGDWDGWLSAFPKEDEATGANARGSSTNSRHNSSSTINDSDWDDIPFN